VKFATAQDLYLLTVIALILLVRRSGSRRVEWLVVESIALAAHRLQPHRRLSAHAAVRRALNASVDRATARRVVKDGYRAVWTEVFSTLPLRRTGADTGRIEVEGLDTFAAARQTGSGVLLWESSIFGRRTLGKRTLQRLGIPVVQLHFEGHMPAFDYNRRARQSWVLTNVVLPFFAASQRHSVEEVIFIPASDSLHYLRDCLRRLRQGQILCVAADGQVGLRQHELPFLGGTQPFSSGLVNLARLSGAPVVPFFTFMDRGRPHLRFEAPIPIDTGREGEERALAQYAALLESYVRRYPDQYRGWYGGRLQQSRPDLQPGGVSSE
jgi:lauroyl/myristoyl acyltransferase